MSDDKLIAWQIPEYLLTAQETVMSARLRRAHAAAEHDAATQAWEHAIEVYEDAIRRYSEELIERLPTP